MACDHGDEEGVRLLLFAVLSHAVLAATARRPDRDDGRWFREPGNGDRPFSFAWVAASLGLSPRRIAADLHGIAARLRAVRRDPRKNIM